MRAARKFSVVNSNGANGKSATREKKIIAAAARDWLDAYGKVGVQVIGDPIDHDHPVHCPRCENPTGTISAKTGLLFCTTCGNGGNFLDVASRFFQKEKGTKALCDKIEKVIALSSRAKPNEKDGDEEKKAGRALALEDPEPWPAPVDGAELLDGIEAAFERHLVLIDGAKEALALCVLKAHVLDAFEINPLVVIHSPEMRCGKTSTLSVMSLLVPRPLFSSNVTAPLLFRLIEKFKPTLHIDEADTFLGENEELRGILNSSHNKSGAFSFRLVGDGHEPRAFSTWAPIVVAKIGKVPDTLRDRAILIEMRRKRPDEKIEPFRLGRPHVVDPLKILARKAARWAEDSLAILKTADPMLPSFLEVNDRAADNWTPLFAIADAAGGDWPRRARDCAKKLMGGEQDGDSVRVHLLSDLRKIFHGERKEKTGFGSVEICYALAELEESPWPEWKGGKSITPRQLSALLRPFHISPGTVREGEETFKGYKLKDFKEAFERYLPRHLSAPPGNLSHGHKSVKSIRYRNSNPSQRKWCYGLEFPESIVPTTM